MKILKKLFFVGGFSLLAINGAMAATTQPNISRTANRYPTGGRDGKSIPVSVKLVCFSSTLCPTDPYTGAAITKTSVLKTLDLLKSNYFTSNGQVYAKFSLKRFDKVVDPDNYNPAGGNFLYDLTTKYGVTDSVNIFFINDAAYGGLGYVDQNIGSQWASVAVMHHGSNSAKSHLLAHELTHVMGGNHAMDDYGGSNDYVHPECGSNFTVPVQLSGTSQFQISTSSGCNSSHFKYNNVMSYAADWSCGNTPSLFTDQWFYGATTAAYSNSSTDYLQANYGNAYRVAMKCWNYRNF